MWRQCPLSQPLKWRHMQLNSLLECSGTSRGTHEWPRVVKKGILPPSLPPFSCRDKKESCLIPARKCSSLSTAESAPTEKGLKSLPNRPKKTQVTGLVLTGTYGQAFWLALWELASSCKQGAAVQSLIFTTSAAEWRDAFLSATFPLAPFFFFFAFEI